MHGGGIGYFLENGDVVPDPPAQMTQQNGVYLIKALNRANGLLPLVENDPAGFRFVAVSYCDRDIYAGGDQIDPYNPNKIPPGSSNRPTTNGLFATKAAVSYTQSHYSTTKYFLYGDSAGSGGTYGVAWGLQLQGDPAAGIVADSGVINQQWEQAIYQQDVKTCGGRRTQAENANLIVIRLQYQLAEESNEPAALVRTGQLTVPIMHIWDHNDPLFCGGPPPQDDMSCTLPNGQTVMLTATDCMNEPLREAIENEGPNSKSMNLGLCVTVKPSEESKNNWPCDAHCPTLYDLTNTDPSSPANYNQAILNWVDQRLADP